MFTRIDSQKKFAKLDLNKLLGKKTKAGGYTAQCPACAESGLDQKNKNHLLIYGEGEGFACALHPQGDPDHAAHSKRILELAGFPIENNYKTALRRHRRSFPSRSHAITPADRERKHIEEANNHRLAILAENLRGTIIKNFAKPAVDYFSESPISLIDAGDEAQSNDWRLFSECLYESNDVIWIGEVEDSGKNWHRRHFQSVKQWLDNPHCTRPPASRICPSTFKPGSFSRSANSVLTTPYWVYDGDQAIGYEPRTDEEKEENIEAALAICNWLNISVGLKLRAIILSGNKSPHCWFDYPPEHIKDEIIAVSKPLGIDTAAFNKSQPFRLPFTLNEKTKKLTHLIYLNPKKTNHKNSPPTD